MQKSRSDVINFLSSIEHLKRQYLYMEKNIIQVSSQADYDRTVKHYDHLITALTEEVKTLPIGHRYTGIYYIKKQNTVPVEFKECSGSLFMRENLVSWKVELEPGVYDYQYYRAVFKEPHGAQIRKVDGELVYQHQRKN